MEVAEKAQSPLDLYAPLKPIATPRTLPELPQFYYHRHFCDLLDVIDAQYTHCLRETDQDFLNRFSDLPFGAQCLFVRLAGRKGQVFDLAKLDYPEIDRWDAQIKALREAGLIRPVAADHFERFLGALTKPELAAFLDRRIGTVHFKRSWKKDRLIECALAQVKFASSDIPDHFIVQHYDDTLRYLGFLYFGRIETNLQRFTLRDLGLRQTPDFKADYEARFECREDAESAYFYAGANRQFRRGDDDAIAQLIDTAGHWPEAHSNLAIDKRDRLLYDLGRLCERLDDPELALSLYALSNAPLCNERTIRLRYGRGEKAWCKARLEAIIADPASEDELNFASDFYARKYKKKRTSAFTDILRGGETLYLDEVLKSAPEDAVLRSYQEQGYEVFRTENSLWRMTFGLLFWDILYGADAPLFSSFDRTPASLRTGSFYEDNKDAIERRLADLSSPALSQLRLLKAFTRHYGTPNGIFLWSHSEFESVQKFLGAAPTIALSDIMRIMTRNFRLTRDGFPDLMRIKDGQVSFIEVKSDGDVIRRNQLTRIKQLREAGFSTEIARVQWTVDPKQTYVVIDVETTGGRAPEHRVTEIGAVKIRGGKIIDEFQTLINPDRPIPPFITGLTGISNDMVKDAPRFEDIAKDFAAFIGPAIFAAHNVNFDYGFIRAEFARMGRNFTAPKVCTCADMRKTHPGFRSYSLKNLCGEFGIELGQHHRALCDARAAAELLFRINEKKAERS